MMNLKRKQTLLFAILLITDSWSILIRQSQISNVIKRLHREMDSNERKFGNKFDCPFKCPHLRQIFGQNNEHILRLKPPQSTARLIKLIKSNETLNKWLLNTCARYYLTKKTNKTIAGKYYQSIENEIFTYPFESIHHQTVSDCLLGFISRIKTCFRQNCYPEDNDNSSDSLLNANSVANLTFRDEISETVAKKMTNLHTNESLEREVSVLKRGYINAFDVCMIHNCKRFRRGSYPYFQCQIDHQCHLW